VISIVNLTYRFESNGIVAYQRIGLPGKAVESLGDEFEYRPHGLSTIDHPPSGRDLPGPIYPKQWSDEGRVGNVTVDFYIDESGRTRLPVIIGDADEYLSAAAIAAFARCRTSISRASGTRMRVPATQAWPLFWKPAVIAIGTADFFASWKIKTMQKPKAQSLCWIQTVRGKA